MRRRRSLVGHAGRGSTQGRRGRCRVGMGARRHADADGIRRTRESLAFTDPDRGAVSVDVAETYDSAAQVTRGTWHFSTETEDDFLVVPVEIRSIFPQELTLLLSLGGLRL